MIYIDADGNRKVIPEPKKSLVDRILFQQNVYFLTPPPPDGYFKHTENVNTQIPDNSNNR